MSDHEGSQRGSEEHGSEGERPRPRVVDKRVSAGGSSPVSAPPQEAPPAAQEPSPEPATVSGPAETDVPEGTAPPETVWTPEQEEQARRIAEEIVQTPSLDWVVNTAVTLANVAATKLELGDPSDASLAIDALAALVNGLDAKLADALAPLRSTLAQLQMTFARVMTGAQTPNA